MTGGVEMLSWIKMENYQWVLFTITEVNPESQHQNFFQQLNGDYQHNDQNL